MSRSLLTTALSVFTATALTATAYAAPGPKAHGPKITSHATTKPTVAKVKSTAPKSSAASVKPVKVKSTGKPASAGPKTTKTRSTTTNASTKSTKPTRLSNSTTTTTTWVPNNPVAQKLSTKTNLLSKITGLLPAGTDLNAATAGFKNFGQFVAAVNVSNNLGIPFADLKADMTGIRMDGTLTGEPTLSLGRSIQDLKPGADADSEATKATKQANSDIK